MIIWVMKIFFEYRVGLLKVMFPAIGTNVNIVPKVPLSPSEEPWILTNWGNPAGQTGWLGAL